MFTDEFLPSTRFPGQILAVDDQPVNLKVLALELRNHPFELITAETPEAALRLTDTRLFEGILMDVSLPGMDGIEVCRRIRKGGPNEQTPLIYLSAMRVGEDWVTQGLEAGGMDYLTKPYSFPELLAKLRVMVRLSRQQKALISGERQRAMIEVAGGAAHELSQPLSSAQLLVDQLRMQKTPPSRDQLDLLQVALDKAGHVLSQIQNLQSYVTKPYLDGQILDLQSSSRPVIGQS